MAQEKNSDGGFFSFDISDDSSKVLFARITPFKKNEQENYAIKVFDGNLE
jgi:hypothetical protein